MMMPGRNVEYSWSRMGYNGQQKDDEVYGKGNLNSALFWQMDTRLMRRWNLDPVDQISISNYAVFGNNPIIYSDVLGNKIQFTNAGGKGSGSDLFAQALNKELGKNVFSIGQNGYLQVVNDKELMNNPLYKYVYGKSTAPETIEVQALSTPRPNVFIDSYDEAQILMDQVSVSSSNGFKGASNHMVHFIAEQWSKQVTNVNKPANYMRDHIPAIQEELNVTGLKLDGMYGNAEGKVRTYKAYFIEVKNKSKEIVGYYEAVISSTDGVKPRFQFHDKQYGEERLKALQKDGIISTERESRTSQD